MKINSKNNPIKRCTICGDVLVRGINGDGNWYLSDQNTCRNVPIYRCKRCRNTGKGYTRGISRKFTYKKYDALLKKQKGCCAICGIHQSELNIRLCRDHNHKTGQIRGLLCRTCNYLLGIFENSRLPNQDKMITYLKKVKTCPL